MQITLDQKEIEEVLINYINQQGIPLGSRNIDIQFKVGDTLTAAIDITKDFDTTANTTTAPINVPSKPTKEAVAEEVEEDPANREEIKAKLDALGIDYAPKTRTPTLVAMLQDAEAAVIDPSTEDAPPFDVATDEVTEEEDEDAQSSLFGANSIKPDPIPTEAVEEQSEEDIEDDDRPLFGAR